jgi:hypothetical protein
MLSDAPLSDRYLGWMWSHYGEYWYSLTGWRQSSPSFDNTPAWTFNAYIDWVNCCTAWNVDVAYYRLLENDMYYRWNQGQWYDAPLDEPNKNIVNDYWQVHYEISLFGYHQ